MKSALFYVPVILILGAVGCGGWLWLYVHRSYHALGDCGTRPAIDDASDAMSYAERLVQLDGAMLKLSGLSSREDLARIVNCSIAACSVETDGIFYDVWFNNLPKALSETWGGRVQFTRCRTHVRVWGA